MLEEAVPAPETTSSKEHSPEPPSNELPKSPTLPEPPVESEASGSGPDHLDNLNEPSTSIAEGEEVSLKETDDDRSEGVEDWVAAVEEEPTDASLKELVNEAELVEQLEISTISTETTEERDPPVILPPAEAEVLGSESAEKTLLSNSVDLVFGTPEDFVVEVNLNEPEEDSTIHVLSTHPEEPAFEETGFEEVIESAGQEIKEEKSSEAVVIQEEAPLAPEILKEDLVEDEILLVNKEDPDLSVSGSPSSPRPTLLSAEVESPFTIISDIITDSKGQPDAAITLLVEVNDQHLN